MPVQGKLLIVVDEPIYAEGLRALLAAAAPQVSFGAARHPAEALRKLGHGDERLLLIADYQLTGGINGLSWLQQVGKAWHGVSLALLSSLPDPVLARQAQRTGLAGYFDKSMDGAQFLRALDAVLAGAGYFGESEAMPAVAQSAGDSLSERQRSVLQLASLGFCNRKIAEHLHLSERTVKYHLRESFLRLSTSSRTEAVAKAAALGMIQLQAEHCAWV